MTAATLLPLAPESETEIRDWPPVFTFRATKGEIVVMELFGLQDPGTPQVRVLAYIRNLRAKEDRPPQILLHSFPNSDHAARFAEEAVLCFEYLGCIITTDPA